MLFHGTLVGVVDMTASLVERSKGISAGPLVFTVTFGAQIIRMRLHYLPTFHQFPLTERCTSFISVVLSLHFLNATFVGCIVGVCLLFVLSKVRKLKTWMKSLGTGLAMIALMILLFGNEFSAYL